MHWAMCVAYYVFPGMATTLIDSVDNTAKKNVFKSIDVYKTIQECI